MTQPTTRTTFKDYCKRKLVPPVIISPFEKVSEGAPASLSV